MQPLLSPSGPSASRSRGQGGRTRPATRPPGKSCSPTTRRSCPLRGRARSRGRSATMTSCAPFPWAVHSLGKKYSADIVIYDAAQRRTAQQDGPGRRRLLHHSGRGRLVPATRPLHRGSRSRWIRDWQTVRSLATPANRKTLIRGRPVFLGYITSAYKVFIGWPVAHASARLLGGEDRARRQSPRGRCLRGDRRGAGSARD